MVVEPIANLDCPKISVLRRKIRAHSVSVTSAKGMGLRGTGPFCTVSKD